MAVNVPLRVEFDRWEKLLAGLNKEQIAAPLLPSEWTTRDVMVHLWAWQQRFISGWMLAGRIANRFIPAGILILT